MDASYFGLGGAVVIALMVGGVIYHDAKPSFTPDAELQALCKDLSVKLPIKTVWVQGNCIGTYKEKSYPMRVGHDYLYYDIMELMGNGSK